MKRDKYFPLLVLSLAVIFFVVVPLVFRILITL
jgi:hypothetical protein